MARAVTTRQVTTTAPNGTYIQDVLTNIVWFAAGIILILLSFRFVLALLGANPDNGFTNFIYDTSHPFVAPFFGLFSYNFNTYGVARFEVYTLVAMFVYAVIAWILASLININRRYYQ